MSIPAPAAPAVISLPLPDPAAYPDEPREYAMALMQRKEDIEKAMDALRDVLSSHGSDASTSLVDPEGFPRGDIDIVSVLLLSPHPSHAQYSIRHARSALAYLTTDLRAVNDLLPNALSQAFAGPSSSSRSNPTSAATALAKPNGVGQANGHGPADSRGRSDDLPEQWPEEAIARVNSVDANSPAAEANLRAGDIIHSFGGGTAENAGGLQAIGALVQRSEGTPLTLLVERGSERLRLRLTPRAGWGGRGSLGCHILPA